MGAGEGGGISGSGVAQGTRGYTGYARLLLRQHGAHPLLNPPSDAHRSVASASQVLWFSVIGWRGHGPPYAASNWLVLDASVG